MRNRLDLERLKNRAAEKLSRPSPRLLHFPRKCATRPPGSRRSARSVCTYQVSPADEE
jgi:hypothetical protein